MTFAALLFVGSKWTGPSQTVHDLIEAAGIGLIALGIVGRMWCTLYIGGRKASEIVSLGPYSLSRNPLYFFSSIAACGAGAQTGSVVLALSFLLGCVLTFQIVIRREEQYLLGKFGGPYRQYLTKVPRLLPRLSAYQDARSLEVHTGRLYRTLADGMVFFLAKPAFELIEHFQDIRMLPVLFRLY